MKLRELYSTQNYPPREEDHQKNSDSPTRAATPVRQAEMQRKTCPFAAAEKSNQNFVVGICAFIVLSESESTSKFTIARIIYFKIADSVSRKFPSLQCAEFENITDAQDIEPCSPESTNSVR